MSPVTGSRPAVSDEINASLEVERVSRMRAASGTHIAVFDDTVAAAAAAAATDDPSDGERVSGMRAASGAHIKHVFIATLSTRSLSTTYDVLRPVCAARLRVRPAAARTARRR